MYSTFNFQCMKSNQPIVTYEVILALQSLISMHGLELYDPAWSTVLNILLIIIHQVEEEPKRVPNPEVALYLHETLNTIENLIDMGSFKGSIKTFFEIIEECSMSRPENSILRLVSYLSKSIIPIKHTWLANLYHLLNKYFKQEVRTNIRLKVLDILSHTVKMHRYLLFVILFM